MRQLGSVQQKIPCVFVTEVKEEQSRKRDGQVSAELRPCGLKRSMFWFLSSRCQADDLIPTALEMFLVLRRIANLY